MQRGRPSGTATSAVPSSGTSRQLSRRAARAGYSAVRSGEDVKIALSTSSGWNPFASWSARNSSAVASRIASRVLAAAVVAPRSPRRILLMALADQLRLMVITDAALLKGRSVVDACRRAVAGGAGATMVQVRMKDAPPRDTLALARALVGALSVPVIVNDRVRSEEHTSELQSRLHLVCRLLLEKKKKKKKGHRQLREVHRAQPSREDSYHRPCELRYR